MVRSFLYAYIRENKFVFRYDKVLKIHNYFKNTNISVVFYIILVLYA